MAVGFTVGLAVGVGVVLTATLSFPDFDRAFCTAWMIPLEEYVAPLTASTFGVCPEIILSITPCADAKYDGVSPEALNISIEVIFPPEIVT